MTREDLQLKRKALGLTQEQLARELDVTVLTVSRWERGVYRVPRHIELAVEALERRRREAA
jgi:transcriptional regulator with XRE-family HTH domain